MGRKKQPSLKACKHKNKAKKDARDNRLNQLPNENLLSSASERFEAKSPDRLSDLSNDFLFSSILSSMTMKEVARMSLLSHRWNYLWRCCPVLNFEGNKWPMLRVYGDLTAAMCQERTDSFLKWVNHVVDEHLGLVIDELRVTFGLDSHYQSHVDKWVVFALQKQVKTLVLRLSHEWVRGKPNCTLPRDLPCILLSIKPCLTSLCLKNVNVNLEQMECILQSFPLLENLTVEQSADVIGLRVCGPSLNLKHLEISHCPKLETLEIYAPKLVSFVHYGGPLRVHVHNAPLLSMVSIGCWFDGEKISYVFDSFSDYLSQLEHLCLKFKLSDNLSSGIKDNKISTLRKLKHLELDVCGDIRNSLLGWIPVLEACPVMEKLSLKMRCYLGGPQFRIVERVGLPPLKCLKTLEIVGFRGFKMDLEFACYVFNNAPVLEEVILDFESWILKTRTCDDHAERVVKLEKRLPPGVKLTTK